MAAKELCNSEALSTVLTSLINEYIELWKATNPVDKDVREELFNKVSTLEDLQSWVNLHGKATSEDK